MGTNSLDNLAANNIINFDADAYVKGTTPRYAGNPEGEEHYLPFDKPLLATPTSQYGISSGPQLHGAPSKDAFISRGEEHKSQALPWSEILTIGSVSALAIAAGIKIKSFLNKQTTTSLTTGGIVSTLKAKVAPFPKLTKLLKEAKKYIKELPPWGKVTGGIASGLAVLYGIYKLTSGKEGQVAQEGQAAPRQE